MVGGPGIDLSHHEAMSAKDHSAALNHPGVAGEFTFVSTAGVAFLEWMDGKAMPGVDALKP